MKIVLVILICTLSSFAQKWEKVQELKPGQETRVETPAGKQTGSIVAVSHDEIRLRSVAGTELRITRDEIARVYVRGKSHRIRNMLIGAGVGVAVGAVLYGTLGTIFRNEGQQSGEMLAIPIVVATGVGAALPTGGMKLIYKR